MTVHRPTQPHSPTTDIARKFLASPDGRAVVNGAAHVSAQGAFIPDASSAPLAGGSRSRVPLSGAMLTVLRLPARCAGNRSAGLENGRSLAAEPYAIHALADVAAPCKGSAGQRNAMGRGAN